MGAPVTLAQAPVTAVADCNVPLPVQLIMALVPERAIDRTTGGAAEIGAKVRPRKAVLAGADSSSEKVVVAAPVSMPAIKELPAAAPVVA